MQSMQPIPIERALVPVLTAELTPKREPGLLARAFSERKRLYALFFAVFFVLSLPVSRLFQLIRRPSSRLCPRRCRRRSVLPVNQRRRTRLRFPAGN